MLPTRNAEEPQFAPTDEEKINYTANVTAQAAASGQLAWTLQKGRETLVWGQALTGQMPDETPVLTTEQEKRVVQVTFLPADDTPELAARYTNAGAVLADYPSPGSSDQRYIFYTDSSCTQAIAPDTHTFAADATLYVKTTTPTQVTITGVAAQDGTYNGQAQAGYTGEPANSGGYTGEYAITYTGRNGTVYNSADAPVDAGDYTVTIAVPQDNLDYMGSLSMNFTIAKKALTVSAPVLSVYVGDSAPELTLTYTGLVDGESVTPSEDSVFTINKSDGTRIDLEDAVKTAGTYTITWSNAKDTTFTDGRNYDITKEATGTLAVASRPAPAPEPVIPVEVSEVEGGSVDLDRPEARPGDPVTVTPRPEEGREVAEVVVTDAAGNPVDVVRNDDGTFTFEMPEGGATVTATFRCDGGGLCPSRDMADVEAGAWYHDAVDFAVSSGLMTGYADSGLFGPGDPLGREQAAEVLYRALGGGAQAPACPLSDVDRSAWYAPAVNWAYESGLVTGYDDGSGLFGVGDALTREQFAAIVARVAGADLSGADPSVLDGFSDGDGVAEWAVPSVSWAVQAGVLEGSPDGDGGTELRAGAEINRAEMAAMVMRAAGAGLLPTAA